MKLIVVMLLQFAWISGLWASNGGGFPEGSTIQVNKAELDALIIEFQNVDSVNINGKTLNIILLAKDKDGHKSLIATNDNGDVIQLIEKTN